MYSIIFMGTPDFATPSLRALAADPRFHIQHIFTQPDKPAGRAQTLTAPAIKVLAEELELPFSQPLKLRSQENITRIHDLAPDFIVVVAYGKIIPKSILDIPKYGCINVHGSLLPKFRGASPIQASLLAGEKETGVSIMRVIKKMDAVWKRRFLTWGILIVSGMNNPAYSASILYAGTPTAVTALMIAKVYGFNTRFVSGVIVFSTILSLLTASIMIILLGL